MFIAVVSSTDDKKVSSVGAPASSVSTVGEVTSSDTTVVLGQPSSPSQDKVCVFKLSGTMVDALSCSFTPSQYNPVFYLLSLPSIAVHQFGSCFQLFVYVCHSLQPTGSKRPGSPVESEKASKKSRMDDDEVVVRSYKSIARSGVQNWSPLQERSH